MRSMALIAGPKSLQANQGHCVPVQRKDRKMRHKLLLLVLSLCSRHCQDMSWCSTGCL